MNNLLILKNFLTPNDLSDSKLSAKNNFTKFDSWRSEVQSFSFHQKSGRYFFVFFNLFSKINYSVELIKEGNFLHVIDLSLDPRFFKYYQFSSHYHKQSPVNNIKAKYPQIGQNVSGISWTCSLESLWQIAGHYWFHHSGHVTLTFDTHSEFDKWMGIDWLIYTVFP